MMASPPLALGSTACGKQSCASNVSHLAPDPSMLPCVEGPNGSQATLGQHVHSLDRDSCLCPLPPNSTAGSEPYTRVNRHIVNNKKREREREIHCCSE